MIISALPGLRTKTIPRSNRRSCLLLSGLNQVWRISSAQKTLAAIAGLTVFVFAAWKWGGNGSQELPPLKTPPAAKPKKPKPKARLVASGVAGGSYIVVRRGSRTSKPIYSGTLENGKKQRFEGRRLWIYVYAPANLRLRVNGRARAVPGAGTGARRWLVVTPGRVSLAPAIG